MTNLTLPPKATIAATETLKPPEPTAEELALAQARISAAEPLVSGLDVPTLMPPGTSAAATAAVAAGWLTNKHVLVLYQGSTWRTSWLYLDGGVGWKQPTQSNEVAAREMVMLASAARAAGLTIHAYEGATANVIDALYVW